MATSIGYAYGYVKERVLTNIPLNIFNAQNPIDFKLIEKYFPSFKEQLKKGDWYEILGEETRISFLNILKNLKYDGFINFEDGEPPSVSIGIFNPKNTKIGEIDFRKC